MAEIEICTNIFRCVYSTVPRQMYRAMAGLVSWNGKEKTGRAPCGILRTSSPCRLFYPCLLSSRRPGVREFRRLAFGLLLAPDDHSRPSSSCTRCPPSLPDIRPPLGRCRSTIGPRRPPCRLPGTRNALFSPRRPRNIRKCTAPPGARNRFRLILEVGVRFFNVRRRASGERLSSPSGVDGQRWGVPAAQSRSFRGQRTNGRRFVVLPARVRVVFSPRRSLDVGARARKRGCREGGRRLFSTIASQE